MNQYEMYLDAKKELESTIESMICEKTTTIEIIYRLTLKYDVDMQFRHVNQNESRLTCTHTVGGFVADMRVNELFSTCVTLPIEFSHLFLQLMMAIRIKDETIRDWALPRSFIDNS